MVVGVEQGIVNAITTTFGVLFKLSPFFFVFGTGTCAHHVNAAITQGTAKYQVSAPTALVELVLSLPTTRKSAVLTASRVSVATLMCAATAAAAAAAAATHSKQKTGRGFVIEHEKFLLGFMAYMRSHYM
jgi:hypothetical protein